MFRGDIKCLAMKELKKNGERFDLLNITWEWTRMEHCMSEVKEGERF